MNEEYPFSLVNDLLVEGIFNHTIGGPDTYSLTEKGKEMMSRFFDIFDKAELERIVQRIFQEAKITTQEILQDEFLQTFVTMMNNDGFEGYKFYNELHKEDNLNYIIDAWDKDYFTRFQCFFCQLGILVKERAKSPEYELLKQDREILIYTDSSKHLN